jgi:hypothetical protein
MHAVLDNLQKSPDFRDLLGFTNAAEVSERRRGKTLMCPHGKAFMEDMFPKMDLGPAVLASLLTPHRQCCLPTCPLDSYMINRTFNCPQELAAMHISALTKWKFFTRSGYEVQLTPFADNHTAVDLERGGKGEALVFEEIDSGDQARIDDQMKAWTDEGILYDPANGRYKLNLPALNLNDMCFAALFQATYGNRWINNNDVSCGAEYVLRGFEGSHSAEGVFIGAPNDIPKAIEELRKEAQKQRDMGLRYMRIVSAREGEGSAHVENIDIAKLLAVNLGEMKNGSVRCIGDCNWLDGRNLDIVRLAIKKTVRRGNVSFQFGTAHFVGNQMCTNQFCETKFACFFVRETEVRPFQRA